MDKISSTFPFGWIRGEKEDNWQILWNKESGYIYLKGAKSGDIIKYIKAFSWEDAKLKSDKLATSPEEQSHYFKY